LVNSLQVLFQTDGYAIFLRLRTKSYDISTVVVRCKVTNQCVMELFGFFNVFSQKALGTPPEDGNVMPKRVGATIHN
jgi:hypothetical protein